MGLLPDPMVTPGCDGGDGGYEQEVNKATALLLLMTVTVW